MKKKQFRIMLFSTSIEVVNSLIIAAAASNGGMAEITLSSLKKMGEGLIQQFPSKLEISFELVGENILCIDAKINDIWQHIAAIEEIEIFEVVNEEEKEEVL